MSVNRCSERSSYKKGGLGGGGGWVVDLFLSTHSCFAHVHSSAFCSTFCR